MKKILILFLIFLHGLSQGSIKQKLSLERQELNLLSIFLFRKGNNRLIWIKKFYALNDIGFTDTKGRSGFFHACIHSDIAVLRFILNRGGKYLFYKSDYRGLHPMHIIEDRNTIDFLCSTDPTLINITDRNGQTALDLKKESLTNLKDNHPLAIERIEEVENLISYLREKGGI